MSVAPSNDLKTGRLNFTFLSGIKWTKRKEGVECRLNKIPNLSENYNFPILEDCLFNLRPEK